MIGHIVTADGLRVGPEMSVSAYIHTDSRDDVQRGDYVEVDTHVGVMFCEVEAIEYLEDPVGDDMDDLPGSDREMEEDRYPMRAVLDPVAIIDDDRNPITTVPRPREPVDLVTDTDRLQTALNIPEDGIPIGWIAVDGTPVPRSGDRVAYRLPDPDPDGPGDPAVFRHILVAGTTGKGKTHLSKNIVKTIVDRPDAKYPVDDFPPQPMGAVVIDPENEYSGLGLPPERRTDDPRFPSGAIDDVVAWVPQTADADPVETPLPTERSFGIPFEIVEGSPDLMLAATDMPDATARTTRDALRNYFDETDDPTFADFRRWTDVHTDQFTDDGPHHPRSWNAMRRRLLDGIYRGVFDHGDQAFTDVIDQIFRPGRVSVIPTDHLWGRSERGIVLMLMHYVTQNKLMSTGDDAIRNTPLLLVVDEAHRYLSGVDSEAGQSIVNQFVDAARQGRKDQFGLQLVTQNPEDVADRVMKQVNTRIYLGLETEVTDQISVPGSWDLELFDQGQCVVKAPDTRPAEVLGLSECLVYHE